MQFDSRKALKANLELWQTSNMTSSLKPHLLNSMPAFPRHGAVVAGKGFRQEGKREGHQVDLRAMFNQNSFE